MKHATTQVSDLQLLAVALLAALFLVPGAALQALQEEEPASQAAAPAQTDGEEVFFESLDVTVVNLDVYVTDKKGNPVHGLTREDFEVFEDGRPVTITNFYAVEEGRPVIGGLEEEAAAPSEDAPPRLPFEEIVPIPDEQRLYLVVYVDNFNISPFNRNRVFRRLREFLRQEVDRHDQVMLVSYDRSLHVRQPFTNDPQIVNAALLDLEDVSGHGVHHESERKDMVRWVEEAESYADALWRVRSYAESRYNDLLFTIDALKELTRSLAGLEGRKAILYVSDGLPMRVGEELFYFVQQKFDETSVLSEIHNYSGARRFEQLAALANTNRVTFYTIDAGGLRVYSAGTVDSVYGGAGGRSSFLDSINWSNIQSPLLMLADATGGRAIINTNDVGPGLEEVAADFDNYYSLGYTPSHHGDDRYHDIKVKVKGHKGLVVRTRDGYRGKSLHDRMADGTMSALFYGMARNPLELGLEVGRPTPKDDGLYSVPVEVRIPLGNLVLVPQEEYHYARTKLYFVARDHKDRVADVQEVNLPITIPNPQVEVARSQYYSYEVELLMRPGDHEIAVGLRDEMGSVSSFVKRGVRIGSGP